jgi:hypothetical protein
MKLDGNAKKKSISPLLITNLNSRISQITRHQEYHRTDPNQPNVHRHAATTTKSTDRERNKRPVQGRKGPGEEREREK